MFRAELSDYLYYIIFAVVMIAGIFEKMSKAKRQQQENTPRSPQPYDDFENVDDEQPATRQAQQPQTLEDMMRRVLQTMEASNNEEKVSSSYNEHVSKVVPTTVRTAYQPLVIPSSEQAEIDAFSDKEKETGIFNDFEFDIRKAIIANEILNKKY